MSKFTANFVTNAGMKDILGRGLIYDDNIAIIELIKNAKDAGSSKVNVSFKISEDRPQELSDNIINEITIVDYGKGMTAKDISAKWLNIAYSEKKGTNKGYAGNKGVGRFSCDRLGKYLTLYTKADGGDFIKLPINWELFENKGESDEISKIKLSGETLDESLFKSELGISEFSTGTVLKIQGLRTKWDSKRLKKLLQDIEKFSPSLNDDFQVFLTATEDFDEKGILASLENGRVNNNILDKLTFQTTHIKSSIDETGTFIDTKLYFQSEQLYSYRAINPYSHLKNINAEIHYLDTISKAYFKKHFGVRSVDYGSIFLFYNGFRVSPYGNAKNDWLNLDQRKSQGTSRNLGTREVFGRIDIDDHDDKFSVVTSREGLAHNDSYFDLVASDEQQKTVLKNDNEEYGFVTLIIRQLENFVVGGLNWNRLVDKFDEKKAVTLDLINKNPDRYESKSISSDKITDVLEKLLNSNIEVVSVDINKELIKELQRINDAKYEKYKSEFIKQVEAKSLEDLTPSQKGSVKKIIERETALKEAAFEERDFSEIKIDAVRTELKAVSDTNRYLIEKDKTLSPDAAGLIHTIKLTNSKVKNITSNLLDDVVNGNVDKDYFISNLSKILLNSEKALKMAQLATKASVDKDIDSKFIDFPAFIQDYCLSQVDSFSNSLKISFKNITHVKAKIDLLSFSIVLDNLISNSLKWGANEVLIQFDCFENRLLKIVFSDNGKGVSDRFIKNPDSLFELGTREEPIVVSTGGSGIGLYHVKENLKQMGAKITFSGNNLSLCGASFEMEFKL